MSSIELVSVCESKGERSIGEEHLTDIYHMNCEMTTKKSLYEASLGGDTTSLMKLLTDDPLILENVFTSFTQTPLHIAAMYGHIDFAKELLNHKPELSSESDSHGFSPLHLAASRKNIDMVKVLLEEPADSNACSMTDKEGRTPLHLAAMKGRIEAMKELISTCRGAIQVVAAREETILHLCVKHNRLEALKLLLEKLNNNEGGALDNSSSISINSMNADGNTILHLAVAQKHWEMIKFLLNNNSNESSSKEILEVNALNKIGFTCLDVLIIQARDLKDIEIGEFLRGAGCVRATRSSLANGESLLSPSQGQQQIPQTVLPKTNNNSTDDDDHQSEEWLKNTTTSLMVVASCIATMAFQAGLTPPGGLWSDDASGSSITPSGQYIPLGAGHNIGTSIMADIDPLLSLQMLFNTIGFLASLSIILLLISGLPLIRRRLFVWILVIIMWIAISSMALSFTFIELLTNLEHLGYGVFAWMGLIL